MGSEYKIIAETAFSHEGDFSYLQKSVEAAVEAQVDIIKFQVLLDGKTYCCAGHPAIEVVDRWGFTESQWLEAFRMSKDAGLDILVLPLTADDVQFCRTQAGSLIDMYEVHSVCFNDVPLLEALRGVNTPIVLGMGGRLPDEISFARNILDINDDRLILMYGFQSFPTKPDHLNLRKIATF